MADAAEIDPQDASIEEVEDGSGLPFTWQMALELLPEGVPEGVRYNWAFQAGDQTYPLQTKRSNLANITTVEAPVDHAVQAAEGGWWLQLRGACEDSYMVDGTPVSGCYHLGFWGTRISENQSAGMSITASAQAVVSNTASSQFICPARLVVLRRPRRAMIARGAGVRGGHGEVPHVHCRSWRTPCVAPSPCCRQLP